MTSIGGPVGPGAQARFVRSRPIDAPVSSSAERTFVVPATRWVGKCRIGQRRTCPCARPHSIPYARFHLKQGFITSASWGAGTLRSEELPAWRSLTKASSGLPAIPAESNADSDEL